MSVTLYQPQVIKVVTFSHSISIPNPNIKYQLVSPDIKSTEGVTYHRLTGKIINHNYPDIDYTVGIKLTKVKKQNRKTISLENPAKNIQSPQYPTKLLIVKVDK